MNNLQKVKDFAAVGLGGDTTDLSELPVKEALISVALGVVMVLIAVLNLILVLWQLIACLILTSYDLIAKGLHKFVPRAVVVKYPTSTDTK